MIRVTNDGRSDDDKRRGRPRWCPPNKTRLRSIETCETQTHSWTLLWNNQIFWAVANKITPATINTRFVDKCASLIISVPSCSCRVNLIAFPSFIYYLSFVTIDSCYKIDKHPPQLFVTSWANCRFVDRYYELVCLRQLRTGSWFVRALISGNAENRHRVENTCHRSYYDVLAFDDDVVRLTKLSKTSNQYC